jgi:hypothetical protein
MRSGTAKVQVSVDPFALGLSQHAHLIAPGLVLVPENGGIERLGSVDVVDWDLEVLHLCHGIQGPMTLRHSEGLRVLQCPG